MKSSQTLMRSDADIEYQHYTNRSALTKYQAYGIRDEIGEFFRTRSIIAGACPTDQAQLLETKGMHIVVLGWNT